MSDAERTLEAVKELLHSQRVLHKSLIEPTHPNTPVLIEVDRVLGNYRRRAMSERQFQVGQRVAIVGEPEKHATVTGLPGCASMYPDCYQIVWPDGGFALHRADELRHAEPAPTPAPSEPFVSLSAEPCDCTHPRAKHAQLIHGCSVKGCECEWFFPVTALEREPEHPTDVDLKLDAISARARGDFATERTALDSLALSERATDVAAELEVECRWCRHAMVNHGPLLDDLTEIFCGECDDPCPLPAAPPEGHDEIVDRFLAYHGDVEPFDVTAPRGSIRDLVARVRAAERAKCIAEFNGEGCTWGELSCKDYDSPNGKDCLGCMAMDLSIKSYNDGERSERAVADQRIRELADNLLVAIDAHDVARWTTSFLRIAESLGSTEGGEQ